MLDLAHPALSSRKALLSFGGSNKREGTMVETASMGTLSLVVRLEVHEGGVVPLVLATEGHSCC